MIETNLSKDFAVTAVLVIDIHTGEKTMQDIIIRGEKIVQTGPHGSLEFPRDMRLISGRGQFALPGLCDMHVHMTAWPEFTDRIAPLFIANGITSVRDMGGELDVLLKLKKKLSQKQAIAPRMWIAGPIIDGSPPIISSDDPRHGLPEMSVAADTPAEASRMVDLLVKSGVDFIKTYEMLRPEVFAALLKKAQLYQLQAAGHLPIRMTIPEVLDVGVYDIQHLGGMCSGLKYECVNNATDLLATRKAIIDNATPQESGVDLMLKILNSVPVQASQKNLARRTELIKLFVEKGTWHTPTLVNQIDLEILSAHKGPNWRFACRHIPKPRQQQLHAIRQVDEDDQNEKSWQRWSLETVGLLHKAGVNLLAGTDSPPVPKHTPGFALHDELKALVVAGLSPLAALQTATINPARFFNATSELGSIEVGKFADMVFLEADPLVDINNSQRITAVISRGRFFDREQLDHMLASLVDE